MTLRDRMTKVADKVRAVAAKPSIDERPTTVVVRTVVYNGGRRGAEGLKTTTDLVLTPTPRVQWVNGRDVASSGGRYFIGDVKVGPITPSYPGGGYTEAQIAPTITVNGVDVFYVMTGIFSGEFARVALDHDTNHGWVLILRQRRTSP